MTQPTPEQPPVPGSHLPALSAGTLLYLWGDRVVAPAGRLGAATLPSGVKVSAKELSATVFAVSFWHLRQTGALQLQEVTKKSMGLFKQQHVQLAMMPGVTPRSGYEDVILRRVGAGATTAYDVIHTWFDRDVHDPEGHVIDIATREMLEHGLATQVDTGRSGVSGFLFGKTRAEPDPNRIAPLWTGFEQLLAGWQQFSRNEAALARTLVETCTKGIRSRQESSDNG